MKSFVFREPLKKLVLDRKIAKGNGQELLQQMLKLFANGAYGKLAQGVLDKKNYDLRNNDMKVLGASRITQPYFSATITGTLRAALSAVLVAMDELNKEGHHYVPISVTTDGVLYKVGDKNGVRFEQCLKDPSGNTFDTLQEGDKVFKSFADVDPVLYAKFQEFPVLRLLQQSRKSWGLDEYIEIKHAVNRVLDIKTRGQVGGYCEKM